MIKPEDIHRAIMAYGLWKARLRGAVATGEADLTSAQAAEARSCEFGKWFYALPPAVQADPRFAEVETLHARFHEEAANVLRLVEAGEVATAARELQGDSRFDQVGRQLTLALIDWSKAA